MDQSSGVVIVGMLLAGLLLSGDIGQSEGAVPCRKMTLVIAWCLPLVRGPRAKPPPRNSRCCSGVRNLDSLAAVSVKNRRDICNCLPSAVKVHKPSPQAVAAFLGACGATHAYQIPKNCNTIS